jgi:PEP-CTERM motif-containing protein
MMDLRLVRIMLLSSFAWCWMLQPVVAIAVPVRYSYTGNPFTTFSDVDPPAGQYTTSDRVEVTFTTIDGLLPDAGHLYYISPYISQWMITDGRLVFDDSTPRIQASWQAQVANGAITGWSFWTGRTIGVGGEWRADEWIQTRCGSEPVPEYCRDWGGTMWEVSGNPSEQGSNLGAPGQWGDPRAIPEPATMLLLGAGLVGLAGFGRKKFKK